MRNSAPQVYYTIRAYGVGEVRTGRKNKFEVRIRCIRKNRIKRMQSMRIMFLVHDKHALNVFTRMI